MIHLKYGNSFVKVDGSRLRKPAAVSGGNDEDAQAFIDAAGITDSTQQSAINTLVVGLKADNLWTKFYALYPFVGGTATTHKYNLVDPQDTDAAFRITWYGGWTHDSNGVTPNASTAYGDTYVKPVTPAGSSVKNSNSIFFYNRTETSPLAYGDIGVYQFAHPYYGWCIYAESSDSQTYWACHDQTSQGQFNQSSNTTGLLLATRNSSSSKHFYNTRYGVIRESICDSRDLINTYSMTIGGIRNYTTGGIVSYSIRNQALAGFGSGMDATEQANFYTLVQAFQTTLGRQV